MAINFRKAFENSRYISVGFPTEHTSNFVWQDLNKEQFHVFQDIHSGSNIGNGLEKDIEWLDERETRLYEEDAYKIGFCKSGVVKIEDHVYTWYKTTSDTILSVGYKDNESIYQIAIPFTRINGTHWKTLQYILCGMTIDLYYAKYDLYKMDNEDSYCQLREWWNKSVVGKVENEEPMPPWGLALPAHQLRHILGLNPEEKNKYIEQMILGKISPRTCMEKILADLKYKTEQVSYLHKETKYNTVEDESRENKEERDEKDALDHAQLLFEELNNKTFYVSKQVGEEDRIFGLVTPLSVADAIEQSLGLSIDRRSIDLPPDISRLGLYPAKINIKTDLIATIMVEVIEL